MNFDPEIKEITASTAAPSSLKFWFSQAISRPSIHELLPTHPLFHSIMNADVKTMSFTDLSKLRQSIAEIKNWGMIKLGIWFAPGPIIWFADVEDAIDERIKSLSPAWFSRPLIIHGDEVQNNYTLRATPEDGSPIMDYATFRSLASYFDSSGSIETSTKSDNHHLKNSKKRKRGARLSKMMLSVLPINVLVQLVMEYTRGYRLYTLERFTELLEKIACTDWYKMDYKGDPFGGFYSYPEDSYEYENAWTLSFQDNCRRLWQLPYPHDLILKTVEMGCNNRQESVVYSNSLCEWIYRKLGQSIQ